jgi:hypothetical protein
MKLLNLTVLALLCTFTTAQAQQKQPVKKAPAAATTKSKPESNKSLDELTDEIIKSLLDDFYAKVKKETAAGKDILKKDDTNKLIEYYNTNGDIRAKREKLYAETYSKPVVFKSQPGESDRIGVLRGIPVPKDPSAALGVDPREHQRYAEKIERFQKQAEEEARQIANTTELARLHQRGGDAAVKKMYEEKANQNEYVKGMGGVEAMQNMSEKERAEAAKKMVANRTGGYTAEEIRKMTPEQKKALVYQMAANRPAPGGNEVATAFTKELMVNDSYRQRYEKMNNTEKQVEYKKFEERFNGGAPSSAAQNPPSREMSENEIEAREILALNKASEEFYKGLRDLFEPIEQQSVRYEQEWNNSMEKLMKWTSAEVEKLPTVRDSEYGPRKEGIELVEFTKDVMEYTMGKDKIAKQMDLWGRYMQAYVIAFKKLDDMTATFAARKNPSDRYKLALAQAKSAGFDSILDLNKKADFITVNAGSIQLSFNCDVLRDCHDPRQDKYSAGE